MYAHALAIFMKAAKILILCFLLPFRTYPGSDHFNKPTKVRKIRWRPHRHTGSGKNNELSVFLGLNNLWGEINCLK